MSEAISLGPNYGQEPSKVEDISDDDVEVYHKNNLFRLTRLTVQIGTVKIPNDSRYCVSLEIQSEF